MTAPRNRQSMWLGVLSPLLKPHWRWWHAGKQGDGRIVMGDENLQGAQVRSLSGARFERCNFSGATISFLEEIELEDCILDEANLSMSLWREARITRCQLHGAWVGLSDFERTVIEGGDWLGTYLERTSWNGSTLRNVSFRATTLVDNRFDDATFIDCDFQYANLSRKNLILDFARCPGARFERCDFRGANLDGLRFNNTVFDRCKFFDTTGKPVIEGPCTLIDPDFSSRGDGMDNLSGKSTIRDPEEVLRVWREWDPVRINHWTRNPTPVLYEPEKQFPERRGS